MTEQSLFLEALDRPNSERRAFLDRTCGNDAAMRQRVESLLRAHAESGSFIERNRFDTPTLAMSPSYLRPEAGLDTHTAEEDMGEWLGFLDPIEMRGRLGSLGHYEVLEVLGRGAFGIVFRALDPRLNRIVAIKVLAPPLATNPMFKKQFLREARSAAAVSHDHVVRIYAIEEHRGLPFIVMECIVGQSLQQKLDTQGALPVPEVLRIGLQIASGLAAAHRQGLVHRDIKPANILLENGIERVKISDFGLARAATDAAGTQSCQVAGTPQYMSPEQARGESVDGRSDLFSLGSVLYALCTGRAPFRADSVPAVLRRVCEDEPRPIQAINPEVPEWLEAIVARLLAKEADERFATADEVAELLSEALAHWQQPHALPRPYVGSSRLAYLRRIGPHQRAMLLAALAFWAPPVSCCFSRRCCCAARRLFPRSSSLHPSSRFAPSCPSRRPLAMTDDFRPRSPKSAGLSDA